LLDSGYVLIDRVVDTNRIGFQLFVTVRDQTRRVE
jgi:hypothetical protein